MEHLRQWFEHRPTAEWGREYQQHEAINLWYNNGDRASSLRKLCDEFRENCLWGNASVANCNRVITALRQESAKVIRANHDVDHAANFAYFVSM